MTPATASASPSTTSPPPTTAPFRFLSLPLELREQIYALYFRPADRLCRSAALESQGFYGGVYGFDLRVLRTCKQVGREARRVWRREVKCVVVGTPWPSAVNHISSEGLVPIVCADRRADSFTDHHALIQISAPFHQTIPEHSVVLLLDDLPLFTQTWYYSSLSYPMLNDRLSTTLVLRDPDMDDVDEGDEKDVPLALQRKILLPFGQVKGLYSVHTEGFNKAVDKDMRTAMAVPSPTLRQSCELATSLLHEGDAHVAAGRASIPAALQSYTAAFHAIHILISGRTRRVLADPFFHATIPSGPYAGQTGMTVRVILRLKLVRRMVSAFLLQGAWPDATFWGMRSVRIMSEAMDAEFEDFLAELVGGDDVGMVFVGAGVGLWKMREGRRKGGGGGCEGVGVEEWNKELEQYEGDELADVKGLLIASRKHLKRGMQGARREVERYGLPRELVGLFYEREREEES